MYVGLQLEVDLVRRQLDTCTIFLGLEGDLGLVALLVRLEHGEEQDAELRTTTRSRCRRCRGWG